MYVVNTCTVTNIADRKSRQALRKIKEENPNTIVVAIGCYAQISKDTLEQMQEIDLVLGNKEKKDIVDYVKQILNEREELHGFSKRQKMDRH